MFGLLLVSPALFALEITVGSSFKISGLTRTVQGVTLPIERQKYANIRVLDQATYQWLGSCKEPCVQNVASFMPVVSQLRPARTQERMWIAQVDFLPSWRMSCLVFKKGNVFSVKFPAHVQFLNSVLEANTREVIIQAVQEGEK